MAITLLNAFKALEARDNAVRSGVPEPVRAVRTIVGLEMMTVTAMECGAFKARSKNKRERSVQNCLPTKGIESVLYKKLAKRQVLKCRQKDY